MHARGPAKGQERRGFKSRPGSAEPSRAYAWPVDDKLDIAYAIAGLAIGAVIILISIDLLTGGRISAVFGKAPARLSVVPRETSEESA